MVDVSEFGQEKFNAKLWVNAACRARHPDDGGAERYLGDLEMKLQLTAEGIASSMDEQSAASLNKVPRALRDVSRLHDDAISLRSSVTAILSKLKQAEGTSAESVSALSRIDVVKQRMEAAYKTLQDAAGLAQLCASVEEVFASGDLHKAAETLANMRRCLTVVGEVPEFATVKRQLEGLEDRLDGMVQPRLSDALSQRKVDAVQGLRGILITIGRYNSLENHYIRIRMRPLRQLWDGFDAAASISKFPQNNDHMPERVERQKRTFSEWLPSFYDEVLLTIEQELKWCTVAFPEEYKQLVSRLFVETMSTIASSFTSRIGDLIGGLPVDNGFSNDGAGGQASHLTSIIVLHNMTGTFARNVQHLLADVPIAQFTQVLDAIYSPYEIYKQRYGEFELSELMSEVKALDLHGAVQRPIGSRGVEVSETVRRMEDSIPQIAAFLEAAVERCLSFTGGSEMESLLHTLDEVMIKYIGSLYDSLNSLRVVCGISHTQDQSANPKKESDSASYKKQVPIDMVPEEEEWSIVQGSLQLLSVSENLNGRLSIFEASLRATLNRLSHQLQLSDSSNDIDNSSVSGAFGSDIAVLRLAKVSEKRKRLTSLLQQAKDPRFHALTHSSQRVAAFLEAVNELVYEVLISKVKMKLSNVAFMPIWNAEEEDNAFALPSFSAYPQSYVTSIGEYLLTLPQQLELLATDTSGGMDNVDENAEDAQYFATEWMFKVAEGATALYVDQLRGVQSLSDRGAQQLSADIEYLCNVLSALSMATPSILSTFHACVNCPRDKLVETIKNAGTSLDTATARLVCKVRNIKLD